MAAQHEEVALIHSAFFLSVRGGLLSLVPNAVPVLLIYAIMGLLGIPLDLATALIATLASASRSTTPCTTSVTFERELAASGDRDVAVGLVSGLVMLIALVGELVLTPW